MGAATVEHRIKGISGELGIVDGCFCVFDKIQFFVDVNIQISDI